MPGVAPRRLVAVAAVLGLAVAACGLGDQAAEEPATASSQTSDRASTTTSVDDDVRSGEVESGEVESGEVESGEVESGEVESGGVESGEVDAESADSVPDTTADVATATVVATTTSTLVETADQVADEFDDAGDDDLGDDDPSFELGPEVVLEIDLARFPPDDAGVGGASPAPLDDDDEPGGDDPADAGPVSGWAAVDRSLADSLVRAGNTAASVSVSIDGDIVHSAAFGVRDPATGDPVEPGDRFRIASISKPITALVAMSLVDAGVVGLDEPIGQRIADHIGLGSASVGGRALTLRQLLTHRSGFGKYQATFFRAGASDCADAARQGLSQAVGGGGYVYSNMNYCVAGLAIEALTGLGYEAAVYRELLTPLGISGMRLAPTFDPGPGEVQHFSSPGRNYMETLGAAGAWVASPDELVTILDALDVSTPGYKPLPVETALEMITPQGGSLGQRGYGLGFISYGGGRFGHTGTIESTHAMLLNRGDGVSWAITVAGQYPSESTSLEGIMNAAFAAGGFVAG